MGLQALLAQAGLLGNPNLEMSPPMGPMEPGVPDYGDLSGPIDTSGYDNANSKVMGLLGNRPQMNPMPNQTLPAFRTPDAIGAGVALLSMLIGGKGGQELGAGILGGMGQGKMNKAQMDDRRSLQQWQLGNQQQQDNYQGELQSAKFGAEVEGDKLNRQYKERDREDAQSGKMEFERMKQAHQLQRDQSKFDSDERKSKWRAIGSKLSPAGRSKMIAELGYNQEMQEVFGELTVEEELKQSQSQSVKDKNKRENELHGPRLQKLNKEIAQFEVINRKHEAQIAKWENDTLHQTATLGQRKAEHQWRVKNKAGISEADKKVFDLQTQKASLLAKAQAWHSQAPQIFGKEVLLKEQDDGLKKLQIEIAGIDAKINRLRAVGGSDAVAQKRAAAQQAIDQLTAAGAPEADKNKIRHFFKRDTGFDL